jgi:cell division protein FtsL
MTRAVDPIAKLLTVIFVVLVLVLVLHGPVRVAGAANPTEYKVMSLDGTIAGLEKQLNAASQQGWELSQTVRMGPVSTWGIFQKR